VVIDEFLKTADLLPEAMLPVSSDGVVLAANRAVARRLGHKEWRKRDQKVRKKE